MFVISNMRTGSPRVNILFICFFERVHSCLCALLLRRSHMESYSSAKKTQHSNVVSAKLLKTNRSFILIQDKVKISNFRNPDKQLQIYDSELNSAL